MCEITKNFILCSCSTDEKVEVEHNKNSRRYKKQIEKKYPRRIAWTLDRYEGTYNSEMDGMMITPSDKLDELFTAEYVRSELNARNCFDFDYVPNEGDYLTFRFNFSKKEARGREFHYMPYIYKEGNWTVDFYCGFSAKLAEINKGRLKFE